MAWSPLDTRKRHTASVHNGLAIFLVGITVVNHRAKKTPHKAGQMRDKLSLDSFGCPDDCGGIHAAKNAGQILSKLHALF